MVLGHVPPTQPRDHAAAALSDPAACAAGDSNALLGSTGQLFQSCDLQTFAAAVSAKIEVRKVLKTNDFGAVQARLRQSVPGGSELTATAHPVVEPSNYGTTAMAVPVTLAMCGRALTVEGGKHALVDDEGEEESKVDRKKRQRRESAARKRKERRKEDPEGTRQQAAKDKQGWRNNTGRH